MGFYTPPPFPDQPPKMVLIASKDAAETQGHKTDPEFKQTTTAGPIESLEVPASWKVFTSITGGYSSMFTDPQEKGVYIGFSGEGQPGNHSATILGQMCAANKSRLIYSRSGSEKPGWSASDPRFKSADHVVRQLAGLFHNSEEGNNQFTNSKNPLFIIEKFELKLLNGRSVLCLEGFSTVKNTTKAERYSEVITIPQKVGMGGVIVHSLYCGAPTRESFGKVKGIFEKTLASVRWSR